MGLTTFKTLKHLLCLVLWVTGPGWAFVFEEYGTVRPNNPVVFVGRDLTLYCNLTAVHIRTNSSSMYFVKRFRNATRTIPRRYTRIVNSRTIRLDYPVTSAVNQGTYYCKINRTMDREPLTLGRQYVMVEHELKAVESIDCRVFNWETMRCTWDLGVNYINMDNILVTLVWARQSQEDCPHPTKTSCTWEGVDGEDDVAESFIPDLPYYMMVNTTLVNQDGKLHTQVKSQTFHIDSRLIVEPAHVEKLRVTSQNSTCATLRWQHNQVDYEKVYRLRYRPQWDEDAHWMEVGHLKDEHVTVCDLHPFTNYTFRVACLPIPSGDVKPEGFWSRWRAIVNQTAEDKPGKAPKISPGGFTEEICDDFNACRKVTLFWQPVDEHHRNGHILGYKVELIPTGKEEKKTFLINSERKTSAALQLFSTADYEIQLYARNIIGESPTSSIVSIPRSERQPQGPSHLLVESSSHSDHPRFFLTWSPPRSEDMNYNLNLQSQGYTLYWCQRSHLPLICEDHIDWISLPQNQTSYEYLSSDKAGGNSHMFGISREVTSDGGSTISSGITWSPCTYVKGEKPEKPPKNFRISVMEDSKNLKIEWQPFDCFESLGYVTHYLIHYCTADVTGECKDRVQNISVENGETSYVLRDLTPDVFYRITAQAVTGAGPGPESQPLKGKVTDNDLRRNTGAIVGIVVGCIFIVILMAFVFIVILKKCVRAKKNFYYHPSYPDSICRGINNLPPLPQGYPLNNPKHHFHDRPLPPRPDAAPFGLGVLDDGYSSAGSNPSNDVKYEPIVTKTDNSNSNNNNNNNRESRNISVTSETCLLGNMEDNSKSDDKYVHKDKTQNTQMVDDSAIASASCNSFGGKHPLDMCDKSVNSYCDKKPKAVIPEDVVADISAESYTKFGLDHSASVSGCTQNSHMGERLCEPSSKHLQQIQNINYVPPQSPSLGFVFSCPPPETPPPPPPIPYIKRAERILAEVEMLDGGDNKRRKISSSCVGDVSSSHVGDASTMRAIGRAGRPAQPDDADDFTDDSQVRNDSLQMLPVHLDYLPHPDNPSIIELQGSPSSASAAVTDQSSSGELEVPGGAASVTRPLSEYMKQLPLHYFEEPHFSDDKSPTTEL